MSVCLSVCPPGTTRTIFTSFSVHVAYGRGSSSGRVMKWGFSSPLIMHCNTFAAKGIIRSPVTSCSRRDHSVTAAFTASGIDQEDGDGSAQCRRSVIYNCLVMFCNCHLLVNKDYLYQFHNLTKLLVML